VNVDSQKTASEAEPAPRPPLQGLLKRLAIGVLGVLGLLAIVVLYRQRLVADKLQLALDELDRADPGWRLPDVEASRQPVPDSSNSALVFKEVVGRMPKAFPSQDVFDLLQGAPPELLAPADFTRLQDELKPVEPALQEARKLADLPQGRFAIFYQRNPIMTLLTEQQETRRVMNLLAFDVRRLAQEGGMKEAVHSCRAGLNVARALGDEPILISQLIRFAGDGQACKSIEWTLALGEPDPKDLEGLQRALELEDGTNHMLMALRGERAAMHEVFTLIESGELKPEQFYRETSGNADFLARYFPWKTRHDARTEHPLLLSLMGERIEAAKKPLHEQLAADRDFTAKVRGMVVSAPLVAMLLPATEKVSEAHRRTHALLRCLAALVAAERYRRAEGKWPESLEQLRPAYLGEVPLDPYDGKPLHYKRLADGVMVYAVGPDGTDDGGKLDRENPIKPGTDLGYRLWDPSGRRQPPRPKPKAPALGMPGR
jgi:hypothetical protein